VNEQWSHNGSPLTGNPATHTLPDPGMMPEVHEFLFEATDNFGCTYDTTLTITVLPLPKAEIFSEHELPVCDGDSTWFTVSPTDDFGDTWLYQWQMSSTDLPGSIYDTLNVKAPGMYTVMITDSITGCIDFFEKEFETQNCDWEIPNVFTPNGDGTNDFFEIQIGEQGQFVETFIPQLQIVIFNRHGRRVFEHNDYYNNWWDGDNVPDGTYFYVIQYARQGEIQYAEGSVTIIR
jgi:gliding motility-associated-like protein